MSNNMSNKPPPGLTEDDFEAIEDAVMETARGRWFLREFARRARAADTGRLLEALQRIERVISGQSAIPGGFGPEDHALALDERRQRFAEIAWTLRERGYDGAICTLIENEARALARLAESVRGNVALVEAKPPVTALPAPAPPPARATPPVSPPQPVGRRLDALRELERLPAREKAALFS